MVMDKMRFIKAMSNISVAYPSSKIDVSNEHLIDVWYDILKDYDDDTFLQLVREFILNNKFPPQSPAHLLEFAKEQIAKNINSGDVFEKLIVRIRNHAYNLDDVIDKYVKGGQTAVAQSIRELYTDFKLWFDDTNQIGFLKSKFIKLYERYRLDEIKDQVIVGKLENKNLIGSGE